MLCTVRDTLGSAKSLCGLEGMTEDLGESCTVLERQLKEQLNWHIWVAKSHSGFVLPVEHNSVIDLQVPSVI